MFDDKWFKRLVEEPMIEMTTSEAFARLSAYFPNAHIRIEAVRESWCEGSQQEVAIQIDGSVYKGDSLAEVVDRIEGKASQG